MPHHDALIVTGTITDIFAHRFVVETGCGRIPADLTPKGAEMIALKIGDRVTLSGEMKPSELKVEHYAKEDGETIAIHHKEHHDSDIQAEPNAAIREAEAKGYAVLGEPRRKPKHFEILGRSRDGGLHELHLELDGHLRKAKPVLATDPKWAADIR
ncbi:hypothetical protein LGH82_05890 [Mesorhizobium sp. PAMC28654]|uniref:hypothetical protein n=1 Tax=Mesorhizobium sp. PAMC28654 TaxID=2880934 RepID=UPI001D0AA9E0|nr:hypothetical protein [Mesorhizobium sp. PAMC28654]UDL90822.1 hypothetical protein LGH82_05890 [Mesorhizobium sp. PAMC28654]